MIFSCVIFSQSMEKIQIKKSTLVSIMKESQKCDSLRVAYNQKSIVLDSLTLQTISIYDKLENNRSERLKLENKINEINKQLQKKKRNTFTYLVSGFGAGLIVGVLISN